MTGSVSVAVGECASGGGGNLVLSGVHVNPASTGVGSSHIGSINIATCLFPDGRADDITLATGCSSVLDVGSIAIRAGGAEGGNAGSIVVHAGDAFVEGIAGDVSMAGGCRCARWRRCDVAISCRYAAKEHGRHFKRGC